MQMLLMMVAGVTKMSAKCRLYDCSKFCIKSRVLDCPCAGFEIKSFWHTWRQITQGRNEVRWHPGQEASLAPPCSNLRSFGSECTVLKKVFVTLTGLYGAPPQWFGARGIVPPSLRPCNYSPGILRSQGHFPPPQPKALRTKDMTFNRRRANITGPAVRGQKCLPLKKWQNGCVWNQDESKLSFFSCRSILSNSKGIYHYITWRQGENWANAPENSSWLRHCLTPIGIGDEPLSASHATVCVQWESFNKQMSQATARTGLTIRQSPGRPQKSFQGGATFKFSLSSRGSWRCNANRRSQNALPFLPH